MAKGNRGGKRAGAGYQLKPGEEVYARLAPTWQNKQGEIMIIKDTNGKYVYTGYVDSATGVTDKNSIEYKSTLKNNNVNAKFINDGTVEVSKGGLFSKKKTFKSIDDFQKEVNTRLDANIKYENTNINNLKNGILPYSQVQASTYKNILSNNPSSQAMKLISKDLNKQIKSAKTNLDAIQDMKQRLNVVVNNYKKGK